MEEDDVAEEEEDYKEGAGQGRRTRRGRFGWKVGRPLEFLHSLGISETLEEKKHGRNKAGKTNVEKGKAG